MTAMRPLLRRWPRSRLLVLAFHRVLRAPDAFDPETPDIARFAQQLRVLRSFDVVSLSAGLDALESGRLRHPAVAITFDDGYADQWHLVQPLLAELGLPSTVFVCPGQLHGSNLWNDRVAWALRAGRTGARIVLEDQVETLPESLEARRQLARRCLAAVKHRPLAEREQAVAAVEAACAAPPDRRLMLDGEELRQLAASPGVEIGAHTRHHPILSRCSDAEARDEIAGGRADLERVLGKPVRLFAYPNGHEGRDFGAREVTMAREAGFTHAFSSDWGTIQPGTDAWRLPRIGLYHRSAWANAFMLLREALKP